MGSRGSFEARNGLPAGSYEWRGLEAQLRAGLRLLTRLSARQRQVLAGVGLGQARGFGMASTLRYGTASAPFLTALNAGLTPYLEAGVRQRRLTLTLDYTLLSPLRYEDTLAGSAGGTPTSYEGQLGRLSATLAYRLAGPRGFAR